MEKIKELLNKVATIEKMPEQEELPAFNVFNLCKVDELAHSRILADLLNPQAEHNCGAIILAGLTKHAGIDLDHQSVEITTEADTGNGRIDILIEDGQGKAIIIENKPFAYDQCEQLKRYDAFAKEKYGAGNYKIVYLTLHGDKASQQSCKGVEYVRMSYSEDILSLCDGIQNEPYVTQILEHYKNHIKQLTRNDMDRKEMQAIADMLTADPALMENAERVSNAWRYCENNITTTLYDAIEKAAGKFGLECEELNNKSFKTGTKDSGMQLYKEGWKFVMLFFFRDNSFTLEFGLDNCPGDGKYSGKKVKELRELFQGHKDFDVMRDYWVVYSSVDEWNDTSWAKLAGTDGEKRISNFVRKRIKQMLDILTKGGY